MTDDDKSSSAGAKCRCSNAGSRLIGIAENGRIVKFTCPQCGETWGRDGD